MKEQQNKLELTMANIYSYNISNSMNALGRKNKDELPAKLNYLFSYVLDHSYWLNDCTIDKIQNHIQTSCDSC